MAETVRVQDLQAAAEIGESDLLVILQGGEVKSLTGEALKQYIAGHGGINSITLNGDYTLTFTMTDGEEITTGSIRGQTGEDGFSPSVTLTGGENGVNLTITDRLGPHIAFIPKGEAGFSPKVTLTPTAGGTNLVIVDATGTHTAFIANGEGAGDMLSAVYDPHGEVAAVGIPAYVAAILDGLRYSNPNLLDNPWFTVNQRGATGQITNAYGVDRWLANYYINDDGTISLTSGNYIMQRLGTDFIDKLRQKYITGSFMDSNGNIYSGTKKIGDNTGWHSIVAHDGVQLMYADDGFLIHADTDNTVSIKAIKVEVGTVSTLANDTEPNYQQELAKCQRYFQIFKTSSLRNTDKDDFRPTMRANPSNSNISIGGTTYYASSADL